jgi:hypothetical protein
MPETMLPLYLWDLRAQVEAQLRALTEVQRLLDVLAAAPTRNRSAHTSKILKDLQEILHANGAIREVTATALEAAQTLHERSVV